jgi:hypothetical protein
MDMKTTNTNGLSEQDASVSPARKTYEKPAFRLEKIFETMALVCGKIQSTQGACSSVRKLS